MTDKNKRIIVTSALPYVNNVPHLGNIVGCVLPADVYTRFLRSRFSGNEKPVLFVGGVDEYGTATEMKARELKISCKELCDANYAIHKKIYDWFDIKFDCYGRSSQPDGKPKTPDLTWAHTRITHEIYKELCDNQMIFEKEEKTMYCPDIKTFVADRFVIGQCKHCGYEKADGDQCEKCGKLLLLTDIIDPKYKPCPEYKLEIKKTTNLFLDTKKIWELNGMSQWFNDQSKNWSRTAYIITRDLLSQDLQTRSITRDLEWGTGVPDTNLFNDKYKDKVIYVWFDAPIAYISICEHALGKQKSEEWWKDPDTKLIQFMAKDNVPFHSIIFPATLRGSGYSNLSNLVIASSEYLLYEGHKFSKSTGVGLFSDDVIKLSDQYNIGADYWRAYLMYIRPESSDSNFVLNDGGFVDFINNILVNNLGNLLHRILCIAYQIGQAHQISHIVVQNDLYISNDLLRNDMQQLVTNYSESMNNIRLSEGLKIAFQTSTRLNVFMNEIKPWTLIKNDELKDELYKSIFDMYIGVLELNEMIKNFMPTIGQNIEKSFSLVNDDDNNEKNTVTLSKYVITLPMSKPDVFINMIKSPGFYYKK